MEEKEYSRLKKAIENNEQLESLSILGNTLDKVVDDISRSCIKNDLDFLSGSIRYQKLIYDKAGLLYEKIQAENAEKEESAKALEDFNQVLHNYYAFSKGEDELDTRIDREE